MLILEGERWWRTEEKDEEDSDRQSVQDGVTKFLRSFLIKGLFNKAKITEDCRFRALQEVTAEDRALPCYSSHV